MQERCLPELQYVVIRKYSLYPQKEEIKYNFVSGINLIIGGNGVGKTTFINLIKYALIGLYKKEIDVKRREREGKEWRYDKREHISYSFFSNRMDTSATYNNEAEVELCFVINDAKVNIIRYLMSPKVKEVKVEENGIETYIEGDLLSQFDYDRLYTDAKKRNIVEASVQYKYEQFVAKKSGFDIFDSIIFLFNNVLFFNESRSTIMWDEIIQDKLLGKYFIDPNLDIEKDKLERDAKYFNSLARHYSEEMKAIRRVFAKIAEDASKGPDIIQEYNLLNQKLQDINSDIEKTVNNSNTTQGERKALEIQLNSLLNDINFLQKSIDDLEAQKRSEDRQQFQKYYANLTPKYHLYLKTLKNTHACPLCNQNLNNSLYDHIVQDEGNCMLCSNHIIEPKAASDPKLQELTDKIKSLKTSIREKEKTIVQTKEDLQKLDNAYRDTSMKENKLRSQKRELEYRITMMQRKDDKNELPSEYQAMSNRLDELDKKKDTENEKSRKANYKAQEIKKKIDLQKLESRKNLSNMFNEFASQFLGLKCELTYEEGSSGTSLYLPKINGVVRRQEEELSESQRFFIDQSFRMSIINFFNTYSFFICETPDSSLDISYERNAAKIFLQYVKKPNCLIMSSNLNNSVFLDFIIEQAKTINYLNLLEYGRVSDVQSQSVQLNRAQERIKEKLKPIVASH